MSVWSQINFTGRNNPSEDFQTEILTDQFPDSMWEAIENQTWYHEIKRESNMCPNALITSIIILNNNNKDFQILDLYNSLTYNGIVISDDNPNTMNENLNSLCNSVLILNLNNELSINTYHNSNSTINNYSLNENGSIVTILKVHTTLNLGNTISNSPEDLILHTDHPRHEELNNLTYTPIYIHNNYAEWLESTVLNSYSSFINYPIIDNSNNPSVSIYETYVKIFIIVKNASKSFTTPIYLAYNCNSQGGYFPISTIMNNIDSSFARVIFYTEESNANRFYSDLLVTSYLLPENVNEFAHIRNDEFINLYRDNNENYWWLNCYQNTRIIPTVSLDETWSSYNHYSIITNSHELNNLTNPNTSSNSNDLCTLINEKWQNSLSPDENNITDNIGESINESVNKVIISNLYGLTRWDCLTYLEESIGTEATLEIANNLYDTINNALPTHSQFNKIFGELCYNTTDQNVEVHNLIVDISYQYTYSIDFSVSYINTEIHFHENVNRQNVANHKTINNSLANLLIALDYLHNSLIIINTPNGLLLIQNHLYVNLTSISDLKTISTATYNNIYREINILDNSLNSLDIPQNYNNILMELIGPSPLYDEEEQQNTNTSIINWINPIFPVAIATVYDIPRSDSPVSELGEANWDYLTEDIDYSIDHDTYDIIHLPSGTIPNPTSPETTPEENAKIEEDVIISNLLSDEKAYADNHPEYHPTPPNHLISQGVTYHHATRAALTNYLKYSDNYGEIVAIMNNLNINPILSHTVEGIQQINAIEDHKALYNANMDQWENCLSDSPVVNELKGEDWNNSE